MHVEIAWDGTASISQRKRPERGTLRLTEEEHKRFAFVVTTSYEGLPAGMIKVFVSGSPEKGFHITTIREYNRFRSALYPKRRQHKKAFVA